MKLYHFPISPNSRRVVAVLHHLQLPCELQTLDLGKGEQLQADFLKLNPNHMIPTLIDEAFSLWESNAIMQYLSSKVPNNTLWPSDPKVQADISRWQFWLVAHFGSACGVLLFERVIKGMFNMGEANVQEIEKAEERFHRFAKVLDAHLAGREWLVGNVVTLADFSVGSWLAVAEHAQLPLAEYTEIQRWYRNVEQLPAWKSSAL
ncbi:MAG: glutathione S-transferase family protein [Methylococcales bacterium]|nr:glutathione S-transferase family protein [Methylococcales bacterium]